MRKLNCVVLIDDDEATNFLNQMVIEEAGIASKIIALESAEAGLDFLNTPNENEDFPQPSLIFLDINMPGMNGWEFIEEYKELPENRKGEIIVVMLTTSLNPDDKDKALKEQTIQDFMHKPLTVDNLHSLMNKFFS